MHFRCLAMLCLCLCLACALQGAVPAYVKAQDASYQWAIKETIPLADGEVVLIRMTSQTWRGIAWQHWLTVIIPGTVRHPDDAMLVISGGSAKSGPPRGMAAALSAVAGRLGSVIAILNQVPNQPLYGGLHEDALISHTFVKFMETKDPSWPCLLPMVKSVMRGMDTVQALTQQKKNRQVKRFLLTGASKRGWTTWLTGAMDPRVAAIAPMVIDTLNMQKQMPNHLKCWGRYSHKIHDYSDKNLPAQLSRPEAEDLLKLVDPYSYRNALVMPKLILIGTNDPYWPVDAVNLYFQDLKGPKYIHYVPNAGHGLGMQAIHAITGFYQRQLLKQSNPRFSWSIEKEAGHAVITIKADTPPRAVKVWRATSGDRDFRKADWTARTLKAASTGRGANTYQARLPIPAKGYIAFYGALTYPGKDTPAFDLCTNMRVFPETYPRHEPGK